MNTEKIREAAQSIYDGACITKNVDTILAELDKAQSAKVLTDDEVERLCIDFIANEEPDEWPTDWTNIPDGFRMGLRYARDNGYLAPAPRMEKLTEEFVVARAMEIYPPDEVNDGHPWYGHRRSIEDSAAREMVRHLYRLGYLSTATLVDIRRLAELASEWFDLPVDNGPGTDIDRLEAYLRARLTNAITPNP